MAGDVKDDEEEKGENIETEGMPSWERNGEEGSTEKALERV